MSKKIISYFIENRRVLIRHTRRQLRLMPTPRIRSNLLIDYNPLSYKCSGSSFDSFLGGKSKNIHHKYNNTNERINIRSKPHPTILDQQIKFEKYRNYY